MTRTHKKPVDNEAQFHDTLAKSLHLAGFDISKFTLEIYHYVDNARGEMFFNATMLRILLERHPKLSETVLVQITPQMLEATAAKGLEEWKLERFFKWMMSNHPKDLRPIMVCEYEDGKHIVIDGAHRLAILARIGFKEIPGRIIPKRVWDEFCFHDMEALQRHALRRFDLFDGM